MAICIKQVVHGIWQKGRYHGGWAVFVITDGRAQRREVNVGQRNGLTAQIVDGMKPGEQVISHPSDEVDNGRRVAIRTSTE